MADSQPDLQHQKNYKQMMATAGQDLQHRKIQLTMMAGKKLLWLCYEKTLTT